LIGVWYLVDRPNGADNICSNAFLELIGIRIYLFELVIKQRSFFMKFRFSLKDKEASVEADVEKLVEKSMEYKSKRPDQRSRYQIRSEEKRKNEELKHKQQMQWMFIMLGLIVVLLVFGIAVSVLNI